MSELDTAGLERAVVAAVSLRTDGDSWEITESVGATALGVAAARAFETAQAEPLIRDDFAHVLVSAAGPAWARLASGDLDWLEGDEQGRQAQLIACDYQAVRTHFFDAYFHAAIDAGIRQIVILAAGLDSRAYRLDWPSGTRVYEIDQPKVLAYKAATLQGHGAVPKARRVAVAVDLRDDWAGALIGAGFDRGRPTAWLAEGLLPYLPAAAQDRLFEMLTDLSTVGSQVAVEAFGAETEEQAEQRRRAWRKRTARMRSRLGLDVDVETLTYRDDHRADAGQWLSEHGWQVSGVNSRDEMARLGRDPAGESYASVLLRARLD
jgi:methyltransferase (TIGR00027 family)